MANIKSAKKSAKQSEVKRQRNLARKTAMKTALKKVLVALEKNEDVAKVKVLLQEAEAKISRARGKGILRILLTINTNNLQDLKSAPCNSHKNAYFESHLSHQNTHLHQTRYQSAKMYTLILFT